MAHAWLSVCHCCLQAARMQSLAGDAAGWLLPEQAQERPGECLLQKLVMMLDADTEPAGLPWRPAPA